MKKEPSEVKFNLQQVNLAFRVENQPYAGKIRIQRMTAFSG